jgi:hypothetical protein
LAQLLENLKIAPFMEIFTERMRRVFDPECKIDATFLFILLTVVGGQDHKAARR